MVNTFEPFVIAYDSSKRPADGDIIYVYLSTLPTFLPVDIDANSIVGSLLYDIYLGNLFAKYFPAWIFTSFTIIPADKASAVVLIALNAVIG